MVSSTRRTAGCGPACPVVWQGRVGDHSPYADPLPLPLFFVSVDFKGFDVFSKSFRINTCGDFSEVFILKGLRGQKNR